MNLPGTIAVVVGLLIAGCVLVAWMPSSGDKTQGTFRRRPLMNDNEIEFYFRLSKALPEHLIFPQVSMQALIEAASTDRRVAERDRKRIAQQRVDYAICDPAGAVVVVIELDDRSHRSKKAKDNVRDARLMQAGIRTLRYQSNARPGLAALRKDILAAEPPVTAVAAG
jgi:hypothetical protein